MRLCNVGLLLRNSERLHWVDCGLHECLESGQLQTVGVVAKIARKRSSACVEVNQIHLRGNE